MFETLEMAPPDPILGLTEAFQQDDNPAKINLSVGVFKDASGKTPVLNVVKKAEERILRDEATKSYKPIPGDARFAAQTRELMLGADHEALTSGRAVTAHCPGGTGALRVAGNYIKQLGPDTRIWLSDPTWANHAGIFRHAGVETRTYRYFDAAANAIDFEGMIADIEKIPAGDVVLLHGCCHNPSGVDPSLEQWARIADVIADRGLLPLVDFAYQGFGGGIEEDAAGLRELCRPGSELMVCSSYSKNFGLYNERVGALTLTAKDSDQAAAALSHLKVGIRANYSNPPAHGGAIVSLILDDAELRGEWERELAEMRDRIRSMRELLVKSLAERNVSADFSFIEKQRGMFSFSGLNRDQVLELREKHSIYIVGSGRINVAGMTESNMPALCDAIASLL